MTAHRAPLCGSIKVQDWKNKNGSTLHAAGPGVPPLCLMSRHRAGTQTFLSRRKHPMDRLLELAARRTVAPLTAEARAEIARVLAEVIERLQQIAAMLERIV